MQSAWNRTRPGGGRRGEEGPRRSRENFPCKGPSVKVLNGKAAASAVPENRPPDAPADAENPPLQ